MTPSIPSLASVGPVDDQPPSSLPRALVERLLATASTKGEYQVVMLVNLVSIDARGVSVPLSEQAFVSHPRVIDAGSFEGTPVQNENWPWDSLELALAKGFLLRMTAENNSGRMSWLFLNTVENARLIGRLTEGTDPIPEHFWIDHVPTRVYTDRPTIFRLYEQNVGPLTPMIAQRLIKALEVYPAEWIERAFEESVTYNRRNWRYIARILENWAVDGPGRRSDSQ